MAACLGSVSGLTEREQGDTTHIMRLENDASQTGKDASTNGGSNQQTTSALNHNPRWPKDKETVDNDPIRIGMHDSYNGSYGSNTSAVNKEDTSHQDLG